MTKKLTYQGQFKPHLLLDELMVAFPAWSGVTDESTSRLESKPDGTEVYVFAPDDAVESEVEAVVSAHDYTKLTKGEEDEVNREDTNARFLLSQLANKTPEEIYTLMQGRMDSWTSLADAKLDLREWLPLMAAILAWKVV